MDKEIKYLDYTWAATIVAHQDNFPKEMRILDIQVWEEILKSTPYSIGYFVNGYLIGWRIFKRESETVIYVAELLILPEYRGQGIAKELIRASLSMPRQFGESIHSFLRVGAYKAVANEKMIEEAGYKIVINIFIDNHYNDRFGIHEDAYELLIVPDAGE